MSAKANQSGGAKLGYIGGESRNQGKIADRARFQLPDGSSSGSYRAVTARPRSKKRSHSFDSFVLSVLFIVIGNRLRGTYGRHLGFQRSKLMPCHRGSHRMSQGSRGKLGRFGRGSG